MAELIVVGFKQDMRRSKRMRRILLAEYRLIWLKNW